MSGLERQASHALTPPHRPAADTLRDWQLKVRPVLVAIPAAGLVLGPGGLGLGA